MRSIARLAFACTLGLSFTAPAFARAVTFPTFGAEPAGGLQPAATLTMTLPSLPPLADPAAADANGSGASTDDAQQTTARRPVAFEYSDAYKVRAKIHKYASFATLPLFAVEIALGQSLYNGSLINSDSQRGAHAAVGAAIGVLFAANTVTGVWNLWEGRKDPAAGKLRWIHGLLMIAADVGFLATANAVPNRESFTGLLNYEADKSTHRNIALASMGVATVGYTIMLFGGK